MSWVIRLFNLRSCLQRPNETGVQKLVSYAPAKNDVYAFDEIEPLDQGDARMVSYRISLGLQAEDLFSIVYLCVLVVVII